MEITTVNQEATSHMDVNLQAALAKLDKLDQFDVAIVCGLYKSGTSLLTTLLENKKSPFYNPAQETNPFGSGVGRNGETYQTRECNVLFSINKRLIKDNRVQMNHDFLTRKYLADFPKPMVVKDPQLVVTLPYWLESVFMEGLKPVVVFTHRDPAEMRTSWEKAPFTSVVLKENDNAINTMLEKQAIQEKFCEENQIPQVHFQFQELKALKTEIIND